MIIIVIQYILTDRKNSEVDGRTTSGDDNKNTSPPPPPRASDSVGGGRPRRWCRAFSVGRGAAHARPPDALFLETGKRTGRASSFFGARQRERRVIRDG